MRPMLAPCWPVQSVDIHRVWSRSLTDEFQHGEFGLHISVSGCVSFCRRHERTHGEKEHRDNDKVIIALPGLHSNHLPSGEYSAKYDDNPNPVFCPSLRLKWSWHLGRLNEWIRTGRGRFQVIVQCLMSWMLYLK